MTRRAGIAGIIFDVDGTLVDSNELHAEAWRRAFREAGHPIPIEAIREHIGKGGDLLVPDLLDAEGMRSSARKIRQRRKEIFSRTLLPKVRPFPGVRESLESLRELGIRMLLASSAPTAEVRGHVRTLGIGDLIDGWTSSSDVTFSKPSPEIFQAALDQIEAPKSRTLIVGDTPYDILAAHRASTPIAAVRCGGFPDARLEKAEWIFDDVPEIVKRIDQIDEYFRR
jgi:HAD superfamily hydrolase (TIGR01509 family)